MPFGGQLPLTSSVCATARPSFISQRGERFQVTDRAKIKAAVIGAGHISRQHLGCLKELPDVEVVALCDLSPVVAQAAAERFGVASWYTDHRAMLNERRPDVVHVTTPVTSHFDLARAAMDAGAHVILEKPATLVYQDTISLLEEASAKKLHLIEQYNYLFNDQTQKVFNLIESGDFGDVLHLDAFISVQILGPGSAFSDMNVPHPTLALNGGPIADFLPHLASLAYAFLGEHGSVRSLWRKRAGNHSPIPYDEFRALVEARGGTALLAFSAHAHPEIFSLRVHGTRMRAAANLFEPQLTFERVRRGPKPLGALMNGIEQAKQTRRAAYAGLWRKLSGGPGAYEGLWELLRRTYAAIRTGSAPPVSGADIRAVNRLVRDLTCNEFRQ